MVADPSRSPLVFAFPAGSELPSGGNIYNRELARALSGRAAVEVTSFDDAAAQLRAKRPGTYLFDSLDLERARSLPASGAGQRVGLVVHHLPSLEPGIAPGDPALAVEAEALPRFDFFLSTSDFTRGLLSSRGLAERSILTVPPALPTRPRRARTYQAPLAALVVANLIPRKGVRSLLEALEALEPLPPGVSLRVVGRDDLDPAYAAACRRTVAVSAKLGELVRFEGSLPYERMGEVYEASHLLVSAAAMETFGMAIHEARAHGLPVVAVEGGYVRQHLRDGEDGFLCSSPAALAKRLVELAGDEPAMRELFARAQSRRPPPDDTWAAAAERFLTELARLE